MAWFAVALLLLLLCCWHRAAAASEWGVLEKIRERELLEECRSQVRMLREENADLKEQLARARSGSSHPVLLPVALDDGKWEVNDENNDDSSDACDVAGVADMASNNVHLNSTWLERVRREFPELRDRYCSDWRSRMKNSDCPKMESTHDGHMLLMHAQLSCYFDNARAALVSIQAADLAMPTEVGPKQLWVRMLLGWGKYREALHHVCQWRKLDPSSTEAASAMLQILQHIGAGLSSRQAVDARRVLCDELRRVAAEDRNISLAGLCDSSEKEEGLVLIGSSLSNATAMESMQHGFVQDGFVAVRNLLSTGAARALASWKRLGADEGGAKGLVPPLVDWVHAQITPILSQVTNETLVPTRAIPVEYTGGGGGIEHDALHAGEIITLLLQLEISPSNEDWPLMLLDRSGQNMHGVVLRNNDGVFYRTSLKHWRDPMPTSMHLKQIVFGFRLASEEESGCSGSLINFA